MVKLGDKVKDTVTGFRGIVVSRNEWINGCVRIGVQADKLVNGKPGEVEGIDEQQIQVVKAGAVTFANRAAGGPTPAPRRAQDPAR